MRRGKLPLLFSAVLALGCFMDGPLGPIPGGPLRSGELVSSPVLDWSFVASVEEIELQLASQSRSRTTWVLFHEGHAYVPSATGFPPGKNWNVRAEEDGRAILRISGSRYPVTLTRVEDEGLIAALGAADLEKYPDGPPGTDGTWYFTVASRTL
jgi:hypothetical protein